jgi:hypothetical protein
MNKKLLIIPVVIVVAILVYFLFGSKISNLVSVPVQDSATISESTAKILPLGNSLDFSSIRAYNSDSRRFNYPTAVAGDAGVSLDAMIGGLSTQ